MLTGVKEGNMQMKVKLLEVSVDEDGNSIFKEVPLE